MIIALYLTSGWRPGCAHTIAVHTARITASASCTSSDVIWSFCLATLVNSSKPCTLIYGRVPAWLAQRRACHFRKRELEPCRRELGHSGFHCSKVRARSSRTGCHCTPTTKPLSRGASRGIRSTRPDAQLDHDLRPGLHGTVYGREALSARKTTITASSARKTIF